ncbi:MAG TPA: hypothetical protein P5026_06360 [Kiritimatiellia bacterium]|nr:hypothetical protein [Kiritimatiellia bacterium]HRU70479.1 hypothetical protein [Kiritimatiellia bacterium]
MNTSRITMRFGFVMALSFACVFSAAGQGMRQKGSDPQQIWLKFEKELGLQQSYAADMEIQAMGMNMTSTVYRDGNKSRTEMTVPFMNMKMVALQLTENGKMTGYTLFPDKKKYCVTPEEDLAADGNLDYTLKDAGSEVFEGVTCKKRRLTVKIPDQGTQVMDILFSPKQKDMPVKMTANTQMKTEQGAEPMTMTTVILFKNYRFGPQPAALFTIPKDYTKAKDMQEVMMGGLFGGGQAPAAAGQPQGMTLPPEALKAIQEAQAEAEKEAAAGNHDEGPQAIRQGLQSLRGLLGK